LTRLAFATKCKFADFGLLQNLQNAAGGGKQVEFATIRIWLTRSYLNAAQRPRVAVTFATD
jgi:hypothetical protein